MFRDRRPGAFVEPSPIGLVAFPLTLVVLAAAGRTKLPEAPTEADQAEGAVAVRMLATICHEAASAFVRRIKRMNFS